MSKKEQAERAVDFKSFEVAGGVSEQEISSRPISASAGKCIAGALIVDTTTYLGALVGGTSWLPGLIGCFIGLAIVGKTIFGKADPLDKRRWNRYWRGDVLGYWITYLPLTILLIASVTGGGYYSEGELAAMDFVAYVLASLVGLAVGFVNVSFGDAKDKQEVIAHFREWQEQHVQSVDTSGEKVAPQAENVAE